MKDNNTSILLAEDADKRTRVVGMKWVKLGEGKDPEFSQLVFLFRPVDGKNEFKVGWLHRIELLEDSKVFTFIHFGSEDSDFTHYSIPTIPK